MTIPNGAVRDNNLDYVYARKWIEPIMFVVQGANATAGAPVTLTTGFNNSTTTAELLELGGSAIAVLRFSNQNASTASYVWRPSDMDNRWPVYARIAWTSDVLATATSVASFTATYGLMAANQTPTSVTTAFNAQIVSDAKTGPPDAFTWTRWGVVQGPLNTNYAAFETFPATVEAVSFNFAVSSFTNGAIATDFVYLFGVELAYTPKRTFGDGSGREARYIQQPLQIGPAEGGALFGIRR